MANELWPISLLNAVIKIITKVLTNKPRPHIHLLVDQVQSAFTKNRYILDIVACNMRFLRLHITLMLRRCFLSLILKPLIEAFSLSYSWLEGLVIVRLVGLRLAWPPRLLLFLLMGGQITTSIVPWHSRSLVFLKLLIYEFEMMMDLKINSTNSFCL